MANSITTITAGQVAPAVVTLSSGSSISIDASTGNDFRVTLPSGGATISLPINGVDGQRITIQITQPAAGNATVSWNQGYNFGAAGPPTLSTSGGKVDIIGFVYNALVADWLGVGTALGF